MVDAGIAKVYLPGEVGKIYLKFCFKCLAQVGSRELPYTAPNFVGNVVNSFGMDATDTARFDHMHNFVYPGFIGIDKAWIFSCAYSASYAFY